MKNLRFIAVAFAASALLALTTNAQPKDHGNWHEKMMSEKIAFITMELSLTPEEAQVFWPVYNQISKEKMESQKAMMKAYHELMKALNEDNASDKDIDRLLDAYLAAKQANKEFGKSDADKYRKVLPSKKVAKLYVAEEKFRRHHIRNFKGRQHAPGQEPRPGQKR
jgi:Spy/CpxP family protein refolding chaperone